MEKLLAPTNRAWPVHLVCARDMAEAVLLAELISSVRARQLHVDGIANAATAEGGALDHDSNVAAADNQPFCSRSLGRDYLGRLVGEHHET